MQPLSKPELIFQLGRLQVFHYPSEEEIKANMSPTKVFWQDSLSKHTYGPFPSTYDAMVHYTWIVSTQGKTLSDAGANNANVVYVDFARKKRIQFGMP